MTEVRNYRGIDADGIAKTEAERLASGSTCATSAKCWRMFTTPRLRSSKVRNRRVNGCNDSVLGPAGAETKAQFNGVGRLRTYISFTHSVCS
jgi:hypothetical protein